MSLDEFAGDDSDDPDADGVRRIEIVERPDDPVETADGVEIDPEPGQLLDVDAETAILLIDRGIASANDADDTQWYWDLPSYGDVLELAISEFDSDDWQDRDLDDLPAYKVAHYLFQALRKHECDRWLATEPDQSLFYYDDGIWRADVAEARLRKAAVHVLGGAFSKRTFDELVERVKGEWVVHRDDLGAPERTIAVANGLLDIETRELRPLERTDTAIVQLGDPDPVPYRPDATCPRFEQFIDEVVEDGYEAAIQEFIGYTLLRGELPIHRALLLVGEGSNGKSTLLNVVVQLLGEDNVTGFDIGDLVHDEYYAAELYGKLANIDADVTGGIGKGGNFKQLVGGDAKVKAREPYGRPFSYRPTAKLLFSANQVPDADVDDDAFFRRWLQIEFPRKFTAPSEPGPDKDPDLEAKLLEELPGILNWALDGLDRLLEQGQFTNEGSVAERRDRWQLWGDSIEQFIAECLEPGDPGADRIATADLHQRYVEWAREHATESPKSQRMLTDAVKNEGLATYGRHTIDGRVQRGFDGLVCTVGGDAGGGGSHGAGLDSFDDDKGDEVDTPDSVANEAIDGAALELVEVIIDLSRDELVEEVVDEVDGVGRDRADGRIDTLVEEGRLRIDAEGHVRPP